MEKINHEQVTWWTYLFLNIIPARAAQSGNRKPFLNAVDGSHLLLCQACRWHAEDGALTSPHFAAAAFFAAAFFFAAGFAFGFAAASALGAAGSFHSGSSGKVTLTLTFR